MLCINRIVGVEMWHSHTITGYSLSWKRLLDPLLNPNFLEILWASNLMIHFLLYINQT